MIENGEVCILHMAVNGELCAKFYLKYTATQRFERFVSEMMENGTSVGIRTLDPNITTQMLSRLRKDGDNEIAVIRPALNDLIPLGRRSDSGIITAKSPHMISRILALCARLKKTRRVGAWLRRGAMATGMLLSLLLLIFFNAFLVPSLFIVIYQLVWMIPIVIYINIKLK